MTQDSSRDPRIDAYIERAAPFAQPILRQLREAVHEVCPQVVESIRWSMPSFSHAGAILCQIAAFKQHASFGYWKHVLVMGEGVERDGMGSYGKMTSISDIPPRERLLADIRKAMKVNEEATKAPAARKTVPKPAAELPAELVAALNKNKAAQATFDAFPPSCRREYIEWITEAKREQTRATRLAQTIEWLAEGKRRNWKYQNC
ncbi:YdeI/OmpD-associated family protein [Thermomonas sp.]